MLTYPDIFEAHADEFPDVVAISYGDRDITWSQYEDSAARLASALSASGLGRESKVGMFMYNCPEYLITQFAAFKQRITPVNVNYRYLDDELHYLLENADCEAVVYHASLGDRIGRVKDRLPKLRLLIEVSDAPSAGVQGAVAWDAVLASHQPAPRIERGLDDLYMLYTGGTTGMPKGVMYAMGNFTAGFLGFYTAPMGRPPVQNIAEVTGMAKIVHSMGQPVAVPCCPLMHGTGVWLGALLPHLVAGKVVLLEGRSFDAAELFRAVERHRISTLVIVGDAFARPMVQALRARILSESLDSSADAQPLRTALAPRFFGAGGPAMAEAGVELAFDLTRHSLIGISEVFKKIFQFRRLFLQLLKLAVERFLPKLRDTAQKIRQTFADQQRDPPHQQTPRAVANGR